MTPPILQIKNLSKSFRNFQAVDNLSFSVAEGEVFGFLGPNGAGKSTTIRMTLALVKPDHGTVRINGHAVSRAGNAVFSKVGALIEDADFYENLSARTNLKLLARIERIPFHRIDEVLEMVGLLDRADGRIKAYSHGMKQRLGIAQALLNNPKLLILDEPTSGLDPRGMKEIRDLIRGLSDEGLTIFLSSHLLSEVEKVCTSLAIINRGRLVRSGKMNDLMRETDLFITEIKAAPVDVARKILHERNFRLVESNDTALKVRVAIDEIAEMNRLLVQNGIDVTGLIPRSSLEDYFLSITEQSEGK
jgi:ABC-2 type transport system ATP-binding protein